jgi:hypothetical protein
MVNSDRTWYDMGFNEGYEAAAKVAREQYEMVDMWVNRVVALQERIVELEELIDEVVSLRDVMNYPNGEKILNEVRKSVESRKVGK